MAQTLNPLWLNFSVLVLLQLAIFLAVVRWQTWRFRQIIATLATSVALGIPFGFIFDYLIGRGGGIFGYFLAPSLGFVLVNGALSYGAAGATAACFPPLVLPGRVSRGRARVLVVCLVVAATVELVSFRYALGPLGNMFRGGAVILTLGELAIALAGRASAIVAACTGNLRPFVKFWGASAGIGLLYEIANDWFPVWHWSAADPFGGWLVEPFVVAFGYVVLFHPLRLLWQIRAKAL